MSLVIEKFDEGGQTPEVRRYKRYRDEVDLDDFVRLAELGFDTWLNNVNIKDKYKDQVKAAYRDIITRIDSDPGSFITSLGRVFYNTAGITNAKKGFDAYGVAASYIGNTLRGMQAYKEPEVKSNKSKYDRNGLLINSAIQNNIVGSDYRNFLKLDYDKDATELGTANRIAQYISGLKKLADKPDELYDFASDEDRTHFVSRIKTAIEGLENNNPNDDLFILGQLGFTDLDKFLYTGKLELENDELLTPEQKAAQLSQDLIRNFENYMATYHPFYTGNLISHKIDTTEGTASYEDAVELGNKFRSLTNKDLRLWIVDYIRNPNYDFTKYSTYINLYGGRRQLYNLFTSGQIIRQVLAQAIYNGIGVQIGDSEEYYFPFTFHKNSDNSSTVFVYNLKTLQLKQVDTLDIPFYQEQYFTEYRSANPGSDVTYAGDSRYRSRYPSMYPSLKKGGILKAEPGAVIPTPRSGNWGNIGHTNNFNWYSHGFLNWMLELLKAAETAEDKLEFADLVNDMQSRHYGLYNKWDKNNAYEGENNDVGKYQQDIIDKFGYVNSSGIKGIKAGNYYTYPLNRYGIDAEEKDWSPDNHFAAQTDDRRVLGRYGDFTDEQLNSLVGEFKNRGYEMYLDDTDNYYKLNFIKEALTEPSAEQPVDPSKASKPYTPSLLNLDFSFNTDLTYTSPSLGGALTNPNHELWKPITGVKLTTPGTSSESRDELAEHDPGQKSLDVNPSLSKQGLWGNLATDLLGAGRLGYSLWSNNRIAKTLRAALVPKIHNTYELYSPVTGAFSEMLLRNRQAALISSQAHKSPTSDASLASARMFEGQRQANDLQYQGFLADDAEIKRTQNEALKRQEDNIARRSDLANRNRDAIIDNNIARSQLEASRILKNWASIDEYLKGIESRVRTRIDKDREDRQAFELTVAKDEASQWRQNALNQLKDKYIQWKNADASRKDKTFSDWVNLNSDSYSRAMSAIDNYSNALVRRSYALITGLKYKWPTYTNSSGTTLPIDFNIDRYVWEAKNGGSLRLWNNKNKNK